MKPRPYHKRWHGNALNGMRGLSLEERGAYNTLLDLMYDKQGPIADDERRICGELDCDIRVWRRISVALVEKRKIVIHDGLIYNERVMSELGTSAELPAEVREKFAIATQQLSAKLEQKPKENKHTAAHKNAELGGLVQSPESIPPKGPKGPSVRKDDVDRIWALTSDLSRKRSGREALRQALEAAMKRGHSIDKIERGLAAFFASDEATRDGGKFVPGVHRLLKSDRWEPFAPAEPTLFDRQAAVDDDPWRRRVGEFQRNGYWNRLDWGPAPGKPGCTVAAVILEAAGIPTNLLAFAGRPAA